MLTLLMVNPPRLSAKVSLKMASAGSSGRVFSSAFYRHLSIPSHSISTFVFYFKKIHMQAPSPGRVFLAVHEDPEHRNPHCLLLGRPLRVSVRKNDYSVRKISGGTLLQILKNAVKAGSASALRHSILQIVRRAQLQRLRHLRVEEGGA